MSDLPGTYYALVNHLTQQSITGIDNNNDIAWGNNKFSPKGKDIWLSADYFPVGVGVTSKTAAGAQEDGLFQVSVYIKANDNDGANVTYDIQQLTAMNEVLTAFAENVQTSYNSVTVSILNSELQPPRKTGGWNVRDITINYIRLGD
jgi:hypothetical protein